MTGWSPTVQVPIAFGGQLACGWDGDIFSGDVDQPLYGAATLAMSFYLPSSQPSIKVAVASLQVGSPTAPLVLTLNGVAIPIPPSGVPSGSPGWTSFASFTGPFAPGYYTVTVTSPSSTSTSYYRAFLSFLTSWIDPSATANYNPPPGYSGNSGASVVWVQDANGNDLAILPFGDMLAPPPSMEFVADAAYSVDCIVPWQSDMEYQFKPYSVSYLLEDVTAGIALGSAPANQEYNSHGIMGLIPYQLPSPVSLVQGHTYRVSVQNDPASIYSILLRGSTVDPAKAAPGGVTPYWYGLLALADFTQYRVLDYISAHILSQGNSGGIGALAQVGVRFVAPGGTLSSVSLRMYDGSNNAGNYPAGTPVTLSVYASDDSAPTVAGSEPTGAPLASVTVDSGTIPYNGFFTAPFSFAMQAGVAYWVVWSSPSAATNAYVPQRCVSPFRNLLLTSADGGSTWFYPGQGPSDVAWHATLADGSWIGSPFDTGAQVPLGPSSFAAQPFILSQGGTISSVFVSGISGGVVKAEVYPDDGSGTGPNTSASPLAGGTFDMTYSYFYSGVIIPFGSSVAPLQANTKYWIVLSASKASGLLHFPIYWTRPSDPSVPQGYELLGSSDGGATWSNVDPEVATAVFMVGLGQGGPPPPTPTVMDFSVIQTS